MRGAAVSLAGSLPKQQQEPQDGPPLNAQHLDLMPQQCPGPRPKHLALRSRPAGANCGGRRSTSASKVRPGSAAASADQMEALLVRLDEVEHQAAAGLEAEEELKAVNVALMERLAEFQATNEANVRQAEDELVRMHETAKHAQAARAETEAALAEAQQQLAEQRAQLREEFERAMEAGLESARR